MPSAAPERAPQKTADQPAGAALVNEKPGPHWGRVVYEQYRRPDRESKPPLLQRSPSGRTWDAGGRIGHLIPSEVLRAQLVPPVATDAIAHVAS